MTPNDPDWEKKLLDRAEEICLRHASTGRLQQGHEGRAYLRATLIAAARSLRREANQFDVTGNSEQIGIPSRQRLLQCLRNALVMPKVEAITSCLRNSLREKRQGSKWVQREIDRKGTPVIVRMYGEQTAVRAELERLERTGEFDAGEIKLLRASEPLVEDLAGRPILRATRISALRGRIYISTVVLLGLTWMATIVYVDHVGLTLIIQSLGIGMAVGNVLTVVRNETSKFMRLAEKVGLVAPHLVTAY